MIRVLHVSTPSTWRGGEQQVKNLVSLQQKSAYVKPFVLTPAGSELSLRLAHEGVTILPFTSSGLLKTNLAKRIAQICRSEQIDLVHTHDSHAHTAAVIASAIFGNPVPLLVHRRVDFAVSSSPLSRWKYNHPSVKRIICVSEMIARITAPALRHPEKLRVIYSGVDPARYADSATENKLRREFSIPDTHTVIGNLSALADHKDYPTFIETASLLLQRGLKIRFLIAGDGPDRIAIEKRIREKGLTKDILLLGFRNDVTDVMQSLDIFLMTSKTEGLGTILLEAFMAGIPVVATRAGGIPEIVKHGRTGLLCPAGDAICLADAVERLIKEPRLAADLSSAARTFARQFSHEQTAEKTLALYREVLNLHEPSPAP